MPKNGHSQPQSPRPPAALKRLDALLGSWDLLLTIPPNPPTVLHGSWSTFEWMEGGFFLIWRWGPQRSDFPGGVFPSGMSLIGLPQCEFATCEGKYVHHDDGRGEPLRATDGGRVKGGPPFSGPDRRTARNDRRVSGE